jgi:hypothetical protein
MNAFRSLIVNLRSEASRVLRGERLERSIAALENLDRLPAAKDLIDALTT